MDLYELKEHATHFFGEGTQIEFDERCCHQIEVRTNGKGEYQATAFVEYRQAKIVRDGHDPIYVPIAPHREHIALVDVAPHIASAPSYDIGDHVYENLRLAQYKGEDIDVAVAQYARLGKVKEDQVKKRIAAIPMRKVQPVEDIVAELLAIKRKKKGGYDAARDEWLKEHPDVQPSKLEELVEKFKEESA